MFVLCRMLGREVLDVTSFLSEHPGGELAILTFAGRLDLRAGRGRFGVQPVTLARAIKYMLVPGKDATEEFNMPGA